MLFVTTNSTNQGEQVPPLVECSSRYGQILSMRINLLNGTIARPINGKVTVTIIDWISTKNDKKKSLYSDKEKVMERI